MRQADLDDAVSDAVSIERGAYGFPWTAEGFRGRLRAGCDRQVLEADGVVNAYGILQLAAGEPRLLNPRVRRRQHRRGVGRRLPAYLIEVSRSHPTGAVLQEVRPGNAAAAGLYGSMVPYP